MFGGRPLVDGGKTLKDEVQYIGIAQTFGPSCLGFGRVGADLQRALASGRWPPRPQVSCADRNQGFGRLGQETAMVPAGPVALTICAPDAHPIGSGYRKLVSALNSLPSRLSARGCSYRRLTGQRRRDYRLLFSYPKGPPVRVDILVGCYPEVDNFSLQSDNASSILPIIDRLLKSG